MLQYRFELSCRFIIYLYKFAFWFETKRIITCNSFIFSFIQFNNLLKKRKIFNFFRKKNDRDGFWILLDTKRKTFFLKRKSLISSFSFLINLKYFQGNIYKYSNNGVFFYEKLFAFEPVFLFKEYNTISCSNFFLNLLKKFRNLVSFYKKVFHFFFYCLEFYFYKNLKLYFYVFISYYMTRNR